MTTRAPDWTALVKPSLVGVAPYDPGESLDSIRQRLGVDEIVKLNWNEGLFGPLPGALDAAREELARAWMYPEQAYAEFRAAVASVTGADPEAIVPGHGIQALVTTIAAALVEPGVTVIVPSPTYGLYAQVLRAAGARVLTVPLAGLRHDLPALAAAAAHTQARIVLVCDPNNPTAAHVEQAEWGRFLETLPAGCVALVDEAYGDFVEPSVRVRREDDVAAGRPLIVLRTFSKLYGLAGLRLGYALTPPGLARFLDVVQEPFNVNRAALAAGRASLAAGAADERRRETASARELLARLLAAGGFAPHPSQANFVLVGVGCDDVALADRLLRDDGLLIRAGSEFGLPGTVRITVAPEPLMERCAAGLVRARAALARA